MQFFFFFLNQIFTCYPTGRSGMYTFTIKRVVNYILIYNENLYIIVFQQTTSVNWCHAILFKSFGTTF